MGNDLKNIITHLHIFTIEITRLFEIVKLPVGNKVFCRWLIGKNSTFHFNRHCILLQKAIVKLFVGHLFCINKFSFQLHNLQPSNHISYLVQGVVAAHK